MAINNVRPHITIVNSGSGCLINPMTDEYIYLLTAKHNIEDNGSILEAITVFKSDNGGWNSSVIEFQSFQLGVEYFPHPNKDIAIIKIVGAFPDYGNLYRYDNFTEDPNNFNLLGYPEIRRKNEDDTEWYRLDPNMVILDDRGNGSYEAQIPGNPSFDEVSGASGGAIVKIINGTAFLAGIQNSMADDQEELGRIRFTSINTFEEIVAIYPNDLTSIFPSHLKSFSFLHNECFNINAGFNDANIAFTRNFLRDKAYDIVNSPLTPIGIKRIFEQRLLIFSQSPSALQYKAIWRLWLEFLTIINIIIDGEYSEEEVKKIFNHTRFIFSDTTQDWSEELSNIVYSDYKGLEKGGTVIIGICSPPSDGETYILDKNIPLIANAFRKEKTEVERRLLQIDEGVRFPLEEFKFVHFEYFKKQSITSKHAEYAAIDDEEVLLEKLKQEYQILLRHEQDNN